MPMLTATTQSERLRSLPRWMRFALWLTTGLNLLGAFIFLPGSEFIRDRFGLPPTHPLYLCIIALFIGIIGLGYSYCAWTNRASPVFIAVGAAGKLAFFATIIGYWLVGSLPGIVPLLASSDLGLACLFIKWLAQANRAAEG